MRGRPTLYFKVGVRRTIEKEEEEEEEQEQGGIDRPKERAA